MLITFSTSDKALINQFETVTGFVRDNKQVFNNYAYFQT